MPDYTYDQYGGTPPHVRGSDTSLEAALDIEPHAVSLRERIYTLIHNTARGGLTCDEAEVLSRGRHQTVSARVRELVNANRILDTGARRKTRSGCQARVYIASRYATPEERQLDFEIHEELQGNDPLPTVWPPEEMLDAAVCDLDWLLQDALNNGQDHAPALLVLDWLRTRARLLRAARGL